MSAENFPGRHERYKDSIEENIEVIDDRSNKLEHANTEREKSPDLVEIRHEVEEKAESTEQIIDDNRNRLEKEPPRQTSATKELKEMAYQRLLIRARKQLPPRDRLMSHLIHARGVDAASEAVAKTIARPSGILGGGFVAFLGTLAYYFIARYYGYDYNFFIFLLLLALGFVSGWMVEALWRLLKKLF